MIIACKLCDTTRKLSTLDLQVLYDSGSSQGWLRHSLEAGQSALRAPEFVVCLVFMAVYEAGVDTAPPPPDLGGVL